MGVIEKSVTWTKRGLKDLHKISIFNSKAIGKKKALEIAHKVIDAPKILENPEYDFKNIGSIDDSFNHLKQVHLTPFVCL